MVMVFDSFGFRQAFKAAERSVSESTSLLANSECHLTGGCEIMRAKKMTKANKWVRRATLSVAAGGAAMMGAPSQSLADVLIHNDGFTANNQELPGGQSYGSNAGSDDANWTVSVGPWGIVGAPDIALFWDGEGGGSSGYGLDTYTNWDGRGNVVQLDSSSSGGTPDFSILFSPTASFAVNIRSFDLDAWAWTGSDETMDVDWWIEDNDSNVLASGQWSRGRAGGRDTISPDVVGGLGQELTLRFTRLSGLPSYLAIDNLTFAQTVPEPSSIVLLLTGLGALAMRRRKS
ncbi:MAG: PEP-CTERM sorting domain-containing protein [Planctomycetaceae bacterium]|mgnify:CR=1 FL=1|nr:PEP-CTERM sorting domain-containing protein [Planctomycetaceae bacterium]